MNILSKLESHFAGLVMLVATTILFVNIILRYFFDANTSWAEEFIRFSMIWITFIGGALCFGKGLHFGIDLFANLFGDKGQRNVDIYINVISIIFCSLLVWFGMELVVFSFNTGQVTPSLQIKLFWIYLAIPLGSLLSIIHLINNTINLMKKRVYK